MPFDMHVVVGASPAQPWVGVPPLRRAPLTAALLHVVEAALTEVYENAPLGSKIVPYPEASEQDLTALARSFVGARGKVVLNESVNVASAGGATPLKDWAPEDLGPDLQRAMTRDTLDAARAGVLAAFGVLPALFSVNGNGPMVRESQRHLAQWGLQPIAALIAEEASAKLGAPVTLDVMRPLQAFDVGGRARAANAIIEALVKAKEAGVDPGTALKLVDWEGAR